MIRIIERWNVVKRDGFIRTDPCSPRCFVHQNEASEPLAAGAVVEFEVAPTKSGARATHVRCLTGCPKCSGPLAGLACRSCGVVWGG